LLQIDRINVKYSDGNQALDQVSLSIEDGQTVGLVGANGAGKSTLLMTLVGLLSIETGHILLDSIEINKKNLGQLREKIGIVFQNPDDQLFMSNVYDDIAFGPRNYGKGETQIKEKISDIMHRLGVEHLRDHNSHKLSGGEKRIIAIATILVMEPSYLLFDEPSSFLDPKTRRKLMELLKGLTMTKLIATHDLDMALELCDKIIILKDGKIFAEGKTKDILTNEALLLEAGLELPFCLQRVNL
jgi:cobalt/nickel transport system ATP-binding protein